MDDGICEKCDDQLCEELSYCRLTLEVLKACRCVLGRKNK